MLGLGIFQALLNAIGAVLAWIYGLVGNFGVSIILLTLLIRVILLPLGIKQIKSMGAMQSIQPKVKEIQKKYKGNKQKAQEETMKLYKEAGVNPLGGCLPLLLQFPILIAMYAVIRPPQLLPATVDGQNVYEVHNNHLPVDSQLFEDVVLHENLTFLGMNLQCSASQSGTQATEVSSDRKPVTPDTPILGSDGQPLSFDATTGDGKIELWVGRSRQDPLLRPARGDDRDHVLSTAADAARQPAWGRIRSAAGDPEVHAAHVRDLRLLVPGRTHPVLDGLERLADRSAIRPAQGRPHRAGGDGAADGREPGQERGWTDQAGLHGSDAGTCRAVAQAAGRRAIREVGDREEADGRLGVTRLAATATPAEHREPEAAWWRPHAEEAPWERRQRWQGKRRSGQLASRRPSRPPSPSSGSRSRRPGSTSSRNPGQEFWGSGRTRPW